MSTLGGVATIPQALGASAPRPRHRVDALLRRPAWVLPTIVLALLGTAVPALADGRDVLADAKADGRVDACYTRAEFNDALARIRDDQRLYGDLRAIIDEAMISNVKVPGQPCGSGRRVPSRAVPAGDGGSPVVLWSLLGGVCLVGTGAGLLARRGGS